MARSQPRLFFGSAAVLVMSLAFCGGSAGEVDDNPVFVIAATTAPPAAPPTTTPPTITPTTTAAPSTTSARVDTIATTVATTTTSTIVLPQPIAPPDPNADEPLVEIGRIEIPRISLDRPVYEGITLGTLDNGPGHWPGSAMPGQIGNVVVAGHRTSHNKVFRHVDRLLPGDEVVFTTGDGRFVYTVRETTIVTPDAMYIIDQTYAPTATLFACHPPGSTRERIVVHLDLASSEPAPASA
jgi:sortase A